MQSISALKIQFALQWVVLFMLIYYVKEKLVHVVDPPEAGRVVRSGGHEGELSIRHHPTT